MPCHNIFAGLLPPVVCICACASTLAAHGLPLHSGSVHRALAAAAAAAVLNHGRDRPVWMAGRHTDCKVPPVDDTAGSRSRRSMLKHDPALGWHALARWAEPPGLLLAPRRGCPLLVPSKLGPTTPKRHGERVRNFLLRRRCRSCSCCYRTQKMEVRRSYPNVDRRCFRRRFHHNLTCSRVTESL